MRKRLVFGLVIVNILLATAIAVGPMAAQMFPSSALRDCCQGAICCDNCCWFVEDCDGDGDCEEL